MEEIKGIQDENRIARYLRGEMTDEEVLSFENELKSDEALRKHAISIARLTKGLKEVGTTQDRRIIDCFSLANENEIENAIRSAIHDSRITVRACPQDIAAKKDNVSESHSNGFKWLSVAASVIIILAVGLYYNDYRNTISLGEQYANAFIVEQGALRGSTSTDIDDEITQLFANVREGKDLKATVHRLSILWEVSTLDTYNDYTDHAFYIGWNLAMGYLKLNDKENAISILRELKKQFPSNEEALKIIDVITDCKL